jgi:HK97 family phage major capsid protein
LIINDVLKVSNTGAAIWYPSAIAGLGGGSNGVIGSLIGYPTGEVSAMASVLTTGTRVAVIGDPTYYCVVDRIGMDIEVVRHLIGGSRFPTGQRGLYVLIRNGAKVIDPTACRVIVTG